MAVAILILNGNSQKNGMNHLALYLGIAATLAASCTVQEKDFRTPNRDDVVFYASFEQPGEEGTKVYANEDLLLRWTADDRVSIFNRITYNQQYKFTGETGDNAGGFRKVDTDEFITGNDISHVVSVYPYKELTKISESEVLTVSLPAEQSYAQKSFGLGDNTMVSVSSDNVLQYKNVGGYLMLKLYGEGISVSSITLRGNNGEKLAGKASVTMPLNGVPTVTMENDATTDITLNCDNPVLLGSTDEQYVEFWLVVPPVTFTNGFEIRVVDINGNVYERSTSKSISIERNTLSKMEPFDIRPYLIDDYCAPITIDGSFDDWTKLDASMVATAECDPDATLTALKLVKVYADDRYIFVYFEWDTDQVYHEPGVEHVPFHVYLNSDGDTSTGGFAHYWTDACSDYVFEGFLYPDGESVGACDAVAYSWEGEPNEDGWVWSAFDPINGLCYGAGIDGKYELYIRRDYDQLGEIADIFSIGFDIDQAWDGVGFLPNAAVSDINPFGRTQSLWVMTDHLHDIPSVSVPEAVDLGLSVRWASFNLGASKPEEYGDYYAWGEAAPYYEDGYAQSKNAVWKSGKSSGYAWSSYKWCRGSEKRLIKYNSNGNYGIVDDKSTLELIDDAARVNLGAGWRIATYDEWSELKNRDNCTWTWTTENGVKGYRVTSKKEGYQNNSIFLPAAGSREGTDLYTDSYNNGAGPMGKYWSSTLLDGYPSKANLFYFYSTDVSWDGGYRYRGISVRPVYTE